MRSLRLVPGSAGWKRWRVCAALAALALLLWLPGVLAQDTASEPMPPAHKPGFFDAVGRWFEKGADNFRKFNEKAKENNRIFNENAEEARRNAANATKEAIDQMSRLPTTRPVNGHERCEVAANGAPDCRAAAESLCRKKGFQTGKSLDFTSAQECPARALIAGRDAVECTTVTFINRAMCQ